VSPDILHHLDRQADEDYDDPAFEAWQELQADLAEEAARDYFDEGRCD